MEYKIVWAEILQQGRPRCVVFICETLQRVLHEAENLEAGGEPLYRKWQLFSETTKAAERLLALEHPQVASDHASTENRHDWVVVGAQRRLLSSRLQQATVLAARYRAIIAEVLGPDVGSRDTISALVAVDRQMSRARRSSQERELSNPTAESSRGRSSVPQSFVEVRESGHAQLEPEAPQASDDVAPEPVSAEGALLECVCCFEEPAEFVFVKCGHLTYCQRCRDRALQLATSTRMRGRLHGRQAACPLCRQESRMEHVDK